MRQNNRSLGCTQRRDVLVKIWRMNKRGQREGYVPCGREEHAARIEELEGGYDIWRQRVQWSERRLVGKACHELGSRSQWLFHVNLGADALGHQIPLCVLHPHVKKLQGPYYCQITTEGSQLYSASVYLFQQGILRTNSIQRVTLPLWLSLPGLDIPSTDPALSLGPEPQSFLCILLNLILKLINSLRYQHPQAFLLP